MIMSLTVVQSKAVVFADKGVEELDGLMVSVLDSRSYCLGLSSAQAQDVVFLGKTIHSPSVSHQSGVQIDSRDFKIWYS